MVCVLSYCRGHCKRTPETKRVSRMFSLKMPLKKKCYCFSCALLLSVILEGGERELDYVNLYFALVFFVDFWKNLQKCVSVVRLGVVVEVCLALWLLVRKIMNLRLWDCHASEMATLFCLSFVGAKEQKPRL